LKKRVEEQLATAGAPESAPGQQQDRGIAGIVSDFFFGSTGPRGGRRDGIVQSVIKSEARRTTRRLLRGVLGGIVRRR